MSKEEPIKVSCTWGDGPDVMVTFNDHRFILYEDVNMKGWSHGSVERGSFDLNADQAIELAQSLISAARSAKELDRSLEEYEEKEKMKDEKCTCDSGYIEIGQNGWRCMICKGIVYEN